MTLTRIILNNARQRLLSTILTSLSVSIGVALIIVILTIKVVASQRFSITYSGFDLVVGAKGSPLQLVLNAMFNLDVSPGNIPYSLYEKLSNDPRVKLAVPFAVGDSYQGFRIIATTDTYLKKFEPLQNRSYKLVSGRIFAFSEHALKEAMYEATERGKYDEPGKHVKHDSSKMEVFEAVIGATVAQETSLKIGQTFIATHGIQEMDSAEQHKHSPWTIVGILQPTGTIADRTIYINLDSFYHIEGHVIEESRPLAEGSSEIKAESTVGQISVIGLKLRVPFALFALRKQINEAEAAQAAVPVEEIRKLMTIVGNINRILVTQAAVIILVAAVGTGLSLFNSMNDRRRDISVMRALGAHRKTIFAIVVGEALFISVLGAGVGLVLGHAVLFLASPIIEAATPGLLISAWIFQSFEWLVLLGVLSIGLLAGTGPAVSAYRTDVASTLAPTL